MYQDHCSLFILNLSFEFVVRLTFKSMQRAKNEQKKKKNVNENELQDANQ